MIQYPTQIAIAKGNELIKQLKKFHNTEEFKQWETNPTEENLKKAKEKRKEIVK